MKIAMLIDGWKPIFGWWQVHVEQLCKWLIENHNCKIDLFVRKLKDNDWNKFNQNEILENHKLNIFRIWPTTNFFNIFWRILALINTTIQLYIKAKKEKYDIIHAHAYVSWLPAKIVWKILKISVIYTVHWSNNLDVKKKWFLNKIEKWLLTWIKYDLEISVWKDFLKYKNINKNIEIIPNWVGVNKFDKIKIGKKYNWFNFLWVWRFSWEKGLKFLINWIWLVSKDLLEKKWFKLNLVWDWEEKEEILKLVKKLKLKKFIEFKWKLFWEKLIKEYKKNNIFILPSLSEWFWLVIIEAFAWKIPIISTQVWISKEIINEKNWFLIKYWNEVNIKNIIEKVLELDKKDLEKLWENWYKLVKKKYSWSIMCEKVFINYKKIWKEY